MDQAGSGSGAWCRASQGGGGRHGEPWQPTTTRRWGSLPRERSRAWGKGARPREPGLIQTRGPRPPSPRRPAHACLVDKRHSMNKHRERGMGDIVITMPPIPSVQLEHLRRCSSVREGGVEPPRPCGHWNLNPARLPIPPPAHWVCLPAPFLSARRLPTPRTLARPWRWIHIPAPGRPWSPPGRAPHAAPPSRRRSVHVSTSYRSLPSPQEPGGVHSRVRDTGLRPPLRSWAEVRTAHFSTRSKRSAAGNVVRRRQASAGVGGRRREPAGVDTGRPGRQGEPADRPARGYDQ
ncbi:Hypothetical Protein sle_35650 [Streptomyces leeuwenhoekii]|uniref:Uncharacterized protein n=1 Tax=Streptomyces leeuwenhoekii TaxID=1437453 RepID=A0A0F7W207_STRLW|nr:Hypothetical Protein sle_35650 [Streptomyces leeuwenhoekii]